MSTSSPPTPPRRTPDPGDERFHGLTEPVEWIESYRPGGLHPIHLGDLIHHGRYKIIRKLGYGSFSTVWLAHDTSQSTLVAVKIACADATDVYKEVGMHETVEKADISERSRQHIVKALDNFSLRGPNGTHTCLVFEPTGPSLGFVLDPPSLEYQRAAFSYERKKSIAKQLLLGVHCLHSCMIVHGDLNFGNILLNISTLTNQEASTLTQQPTEHEISPPVVRKDGKPDKWAPRYLCREKPLAEFVDLDGSIEVKLSDLGAAFPFSQPPERLATPVSLRAPELVLGGAITNKVDIWNLACLVFEIIVGRAIFLVDSLGPQTETDDDHLLQMIDVLGHMPPATFARWSRRHRYFGPDLELIRSDVGPDDDAYTPEDGEPAIVVGPNLEQMFDENPVAGATADDIHAITTLLRRMLQYEPDCRPTTAELLEDEWFALIES